METNRKIKFDENFGGRKVLKKTVIVKCTKGIQDKVRQRMVYVQV